MPIAFGNPALLLGTLAAALPILIHLLSRRRVRRIPFSDLRFLRDAQTRQARSLGLRRWLLLLLRVLAILCIAFAMARPQWGGLAPSAGGGRSVLFVLDTSASMGTQEESGTRLAAAIADCAAMVAELPDDSAVQVLAAGAVVTPLFATWLPVGTVGAEAWNDLAVSDGGFDLAAALRAAARQVATAPGIPVEVVLLSDLQAAPLSAELVEAVRLLRGAGETRLLVRPVGGTVANTGVLAVELPRRAVRPGETVLVRARVATGTADPVLRLELDGQPVAETVVAAAAGAEALARFSLTVPSVGRHRGWVRAETDRFAADDARPFVLDVRDQVVARLVHGADRDALGRGGWRYLAAALVPAGPGGDAAVALQVSPTAGLAAGDLTGVDVVIFVDPEPLGRQLLAGLLAWLRRGGAAVFLCGDPTLAVYLQETLLPALDLSPPAIFVARERAEGERTEITAPEHPLFAGLGEEALATLREVTWWRTFTLADDGAQVLLALTGGAPLLLEKRVGAGRVALLASHLRDEATNLASSPMSLPLWQRLIGYLAWRQGEASGTLDVGEPPVLPVLRRGTAARDLDELGPIEVRGPGATVGPARLRWRDELPLLAGDTTERAGFYGFVAGNDTLGFVAAAVPPAESVSTRWTAATLADSLAARGLPRALPLDDRAVAGFAAALRGRDLGPWLLAAAVLLLLLELFLGRGAERPRERAES